MMYAKTIATLTVASAIGLSVAVFWPDPSANQLWQVEIESSTNLLDWQPWTNAIAITTEPQRFFRGVSTVTLGWDAVPASDVTYRVWIGSRPDRLNTFVDVGTNTVARVRAVALTNYFAVTACDPYGVESDHSNHVTGVVDRAVLVLKKN